MNYLKHIFIIIIIFSFIQESNAQAISYYPFGNAQQLSIATNPTKVVWMDFRFQMNSFISSLNTEPALMVNLAYTRNANFYVGGGANLGIVGAYPLEKAPKVSINFELSPYVQYDGAAGQFRAWLGLGYHFGGK
jgi:hypothetical protein